jgi:protein required for attachment to host cells
MADMGGEMARNRALLNYGSLVASNGRACQSEFVIGGRSFGDAGANHFGRRGVKPEACSKGAEAMKPTKTWIVVADGDQAKIFEHDGPGRGLHAVDGLTLEQSHLQARDIMADKPGRAGAGTAPGSRAAMEYHTDPVEVRERRFVERLADLLDERHEAGDFDRLLIAAAPAALGDLRPALSQGVREAIMAELPKDLTNIPTAKLAEHFDGLIAV